MFARSIVHHQRNRETAVSYLTIGCVGLIGMNSLALHHHIFVKLVVPTIIGDRESRGGFPRKNAHKPSDNTACYELQKHTIVCFYLEHLQSFQKWVAQSNQRDWSSIDIIHIIKQRDTSSTLHWAQFWTPNRFREEQHGHVTFLQMRISRRDMNTMNLKTILCHSGEATFLKITLIILFPRIGAVFL